MATTTLIALLAAAAHAATPLPGDNVNMVSGRAWPGGDPFGQRQNEPSIAVSSVNPQHLLAAANDYRTVDLTVASLPDETSDAWLSVFKSLDGGATWQSTLHPGYPQLGSAANRASPLYGLGAASDPVVRAGTNGLFYYSGIAFNRGTNVGKVFVSRLIDLNNQESGDATVGNDPIRFIDTHVVDTGTSGQFQDKPWVATDVPRKGALTCNIAVGGKTVSFPGGNVYFAYATFTGSQQSSSKVYFTRSLDCGQTWATPQKLSESNALNQGTTIAIDPTNGDVWVFWRRFAVPNQGDAIMMARSSNAGATFTKATVLPGADFSTTPTAPPFDHPDSATSFRSEAFPTAAISVDAAGKSFVHVAWAQRLASATATGESRIVMTTFDGNTWSTPQPADPGPFKEDDSTYLFAHGHQLMPALTFSQGRLMLLYYDSHLDHARRYFQPNPDFLTDGRLFKEWLAPIGANPPSGGLLFDDLDGAPIFTPFIDDAGLADTRHTVDVRVAELPPGAFAPGTAPPAPASVRVTNFPFGIRSDAPTTTTLFDSTTMPVLLPGGSNPLGVAAYQQIQSNPPDLPLFAQGTLPFIGDYVDIQGPAFVRTPTGWTWNTAPAPFPVFHAVWTSNQDVRGPPAGTNPATGKPWAWTDYTPPGSITLQPDGRFVATPNPACNPALSGMRDQNVYTSRITEGLLVSSPQNVKSLDVPRGFVIQAQNTTSSDLLVTLCLPGSGCAGAPPALSNVDASFQSLSLAARTPSVTFHVAPRATVYRSVFARVTTGTAFYTAIPVAWSESTTGLRGTLTLNPMDANFSLVDVNGATVASESYLASIANAQVTSAQVTSAQVTSGNVTSAQVTSAQVTSGNVTSAQVTSAKVTSAQVTSGNVTSGNVTSGNVTSGNVTSAALPESNYTVTNTGNTTQSYHVKLIGPTASSTSGVQLILYGTYFTQAVDPFTCGLLPDDVPHVYVTSVVNDPPIVAFDDPSLADPATSDGGPANATFVLAPGETKQITVRGLATPDVTTNVPAVVPHAGGSVAAPLFVASDGAALPTPRLDVAYSATLKAMGGTSPYAWSLIGGSLPPGLVLGGAGDLTGTPSQVGSFTFTVQVADSATPAHTAQRILSLVVATATPTVTLASSPNPSGFGQVVTLTATVAGPSGGPTQPTGSVSFYDGCTSTSSGVQPGTLLGGPVALASGSSAFTISTLTAGSHPLCAAFTSADANFSNGTSAVLTQTVNGWTFTGFITPLKTASSLVPPGYSVTSSSGSQKFGSAVPIKWQLRNGTTPLTDPNATIGSLVAYFNPGAPGSCTGPIPGTPPWPPPSSTVSYVLFPLTTGNSTFRYDATTNQFIINWDTTKVAAAGCYDIVLTLADGSPPRATAVQLR